MAEEKKTVTPEDIDAAIASEEFSKVGQKTTVCVLTLRNGFEVIGTSSCVDPASYNQEIGNKFAKQRAMDKVWELEGYKLQCARAAQ